MKFLEFLQSSTGEFSSKRLFGIGCFIVAIILAFTGKPADVIGVFTVPATLVFIGQAVSKT